MHKLTWYLVVQTKKRGIEEQRKNQYSYFLNNQENTQFISLIHPRRKEEHRTFGFP